ncbi:MAG: hypothetical protein EBS49_03865 [Verrucomicrobia bacterium]|nr:hypothetical protein [Verrucomicrobiota bacterium]NBU68743.1 hypothetical protein [Verrucomicrobiota bacterium]
MAKRGKSRDTLVWTVVSGLVLVGIGLYLRDRGLLRLPEPKPVAPAERAKDLLKKYPDAEVFSGPEADKKKVTPP